MAADQRKEVRLALAHRQHTQREHIEVGLIRIMLAGVSHTKKQWTVGERIDYGVAMNIMSSILESAPFYPK
jgi:hypothetical protein